ncbi:TonB-dependent receptor [Sulfurimonas sp.]|uniref:TonB-dependent receptor n=1 Tax=Sulfurimonas sp. TaxID=2022749 RepID=UPI002B4819E7|nr:TonB-dependent receptor [Sulfurimonas sp.]
MNKQNKIVLSLVTAFILSNNIYAKDTKSFDTITVTAQKTEENIQNIPLSITVFDEYSIADKNIKTIKDIAAYTPNLVFFDGGGVGVPNPTIRGISSNTNFSSSATMFVDGIPVTSRFGYKEVLEDIQRIEVLKGPQGTLYGKDTHAGVINVITNKPTNETKGKIGLEFGSDNKKEYSFGISGAIVKDKFFIGISGRHYEKDGFIKNTNPTGSTDTRKDNFGKLYLRYTPTDNLEISFITSMYKQDDGRKKDNVVNNDTRIVSTNLKEFNKSETLSNALKVKYSIGDYTLESITASRQYNDKAACDTDYSPGVFFEIPKKDGEFKKISQEFKLSKIKDNYNFVSGVYFDKETNNLIANANMYIPLANQTFYNMPYINTNEDGKSIGIFAHLNYKLNNKLSIIGGLRYDKDEKIFKDKLNGDDLSNEYGSLSPKLAFEYNINSSSMIYITVAKGYKSGGYHSFAPVGYNKKYDKEELISYEIGSKNILLDNKLTFNTAIYYMDISDMQVYNDINAQGQSYISNAAKASSKGIEFDLNYQASTNINVFAAMGYNITKLEDYSDSQGNYSGNYNPHAPKYNYNLGAKYRDGSGYFGKFDITGYGKTYLDKANKYSKDAYNLVNTKIGYETESYDLYFYANNLFDKIHNANGEINGQVVTYSEPREIGIQLAYRF